MTQEKLSLVRKPAGCRPEYPNVAEKQACDPIERTKKPALKAGFKSGIKNTAHSLPCWYTSLFSGRLSSFHGLFGSSFSGWLSSFHGLFGSGFSGRLGSFHGFFGSGFGGRLSSFHGLLGSGFSGLTNSFHSLFGSGFSGLSSGFYSLTSGFHSFARGFHSFLGGGLCGLTSRFYSLTGSLRSFCSFLGNSVSSLLNLFHYRHFRFSRGGLGCLIGGLTTTSGQGGRYEGSNN
jgi:hypothetical protein